MGSFHKIITYHKSILIADLANGHIGNGPQGAEDTVPVVGYRPSSEARAIYLAAPLPEGVVPALRPMEPVGNIVPVALSPAAMRRAFGLYSPWSGKFLVAARPVTSTDVAHAILTAVVPQEWETFWLEEAAGSEIPQTLRAAAPLLDQVTATGLSAKSMLALIEHAPSAEASRDVLNAAGLILSRTQLDCLATLLSQRPDLIARLEQIYPHDLAAQHALRRTSDWLVAHAKADSPEPPEPPPGRSRRRLSWRRILGSAPQGVPQHPKRLPETLATNVWEAGPDLDALDRIGMGGTFVSLPHACNIVMRRAAKPRHRTCVLATARNEGLYLIDWIAHHKALHFDHLFIYTNDNLDGSDRLLRRLADAGEISWIRSSVSPGTRPQFKAYNHALQIMPQTLDYEWTLVIDLDEYFSLNQSFFSHVEDYLDWCERNPVDAVAFNWVVIGSNGETHWRDLPLRQRFPIGHHPRDAAKASSPLIKSMFRTRAAPISMPHHPTPSRNDDLVVRSASMRPFEWRSETGPAQSVTPDASTAWISHYFFKSNEEFLLKFYRTRASQRSASGAEFSALNPEFVSMFQKNAGSSMATAEPHPLDGIFQKNVQRIMSLPGVAEEFAAIKDFYAKFFRALPEEARHCHGLVQAGADGEAFLRPLLRPPEDRQQSQSRPVRQVARSI